MIELEGKCKSSRNPNKNALFFLVIKKKTTKGQSGSLKPKYKEIAVCHVVWEAFDIAFFIVLVLVLLGNCKNLSYANS